MSDTPKDFIKRFIAFSMGPIFSAVLGFIIVPVTTYFVVPEELGKSSMYTMLLSISTLFIYLGLDQAFVREFNIEEDKKKLFLNSLIVPFIFSIVVGILYIIFYEKISISLFESKQRYIIVMLAIALPFTVIDRFNLLLLRMQEKARIYSLMNIMNKLLNMIVLIPYLLYIDKSFKGIVTATFISLIMTVLIEFYFTKEYWLNKFKLDYALLNKIFRYGFPLIPASVIVWFLNSMDKIAMRQWSTFNEIGLYSAAFKIVTVLNIIQQAFCTFWSPTAFRWYEEGAENSRYEKVSKIVMCFMSFMFIGIVLFRNLIIKIMSPDYVSASVIVPFLLFLPIMYTVSEATTLGISFSRKTGYNILVSVVAAVVNYILNYSLVPKYGALGASIATGICYVVFFWMRTLISRKLWFKFEIKFYILNTIFMVLLASVDVMYNNVLVNLIISFVIIFINRRQIFDIFNYGKMFFKRKNDNLCN
ncbi:oligosaccharide flippase family protein [Clostridium oceanicum]|uniref:Oligosaccharide flippase family protein n=1 Tax=Clostridium oceanicum TaxID=1543 RepID=A0ABN1JWA0_9CLOT